MTYITEILDAKSGAISLAGMASVLMIGMERIVSSIYAESSRHHGT